VPAPKEAEIGSGIGDDDLLLMIHFSFPLARVISEFRDAVKEILPVGARDSGLA
jgi:hypothetical protein